MPWFVTFIYAEWTSYVVLVDGDEGLVEEGEDVEGAHLPPVHPEGGEGGLAAPHPPPHPPEGGALLAKARLHHHQRHRPEEEAKAHLEVGEGGRAGTSASSKNESINTVDSMALTIAQQIGFIFHTFGIYLEKLFLRFFLSW